MYSLTGKGELEQSETECLADLLYLCAFEPGEKGVHRCGMNILSPVYIRESQPFPGERFMLCTFKTLISPFLASLFIGYLNIHRPSMTVNNASNLCKR